VLGRQGDVVPLWKWENGADKMFVAEF